MNHDVSQERAAEALAFAQKVLQTILWRSVASDGIRWDAQVAGDVARQGLTRIDAILRGREEPPR